MEIITIEDKAFFSLVEEVTRRIKEQFAIKEDKWISGEVAMKKLGITSKTTLQKLRDTGAIRFSQPKKKIILYDIESINTYLEQHVKGNL